MKENDSTGCFPETGEERQRGEEIKSYAKEKNIRRKAIRENRVRRSGGPVFAGSS